MRVLAANRGRNIAAVLCFTIAASLLLVDTVHCRWSSEDEDGDADVDLDLDLEGTASLESEGDEKLVSFEENGAATEQEERSYDDSEPTPATGCSGYTCYFTKFCGRAQNQLSFDSRSSSLAQYIGRGEDQIYGEWPSYARIFIRNTSEPDRLKICGGTIVSDYHILTAAHCVNSAALEVEVVLGEHSLNDRDAYEQKYKVKETCVAPKYVPYDTVSHPRADYDYTVLTTDRRIKFSPYVAPACLPYGYSRGQTSYRHCHHIGAGVIRYDTSRPLFPKVVQKVRVQQESCEKYRSNFLPEIHTCYTKSGGEGGSCVGDSGGPVLCLNSRSRWTVIALASYGSNEECSGFGIAGWTSVNTRLTTLLSDVKGSCSL